MTASPFAADDCCSNESPYFTDAQPPASEPIHDSHVASRPPTHQPAQTRASERCQTAEMFLFVPWPMPGLVQQVASHNRHFLYGWQTYTSGAVIAGAFQAPTLADARSVLSTMSRGSIQGPRVLGTISYSAAESDFDASLGNQKGGDSLPEQDLVRLVVDTSVQPVSPTTCASNPHAVVIMFSPPSRRRYQYFALDSSQSASSFSAATSAAPCARSKVESSAADSEKASGEPKTSACSRTNGKLLALAASDFTSRADPVSVNLGEAVEQINASNCFSPVDQESVEHTPEGGIEPTVIEKTSMARAAQVPRRNSHWLSSRSFPLFTSAEVQELSATVQQLRLRMSQGFMLPSQYRLIRHAKRNTRERDAHSLVCGRVHYISCFNLLWLIANDVIVGIAIASFVCENHVVIGRGLGELLRMSNSAWLSKLLMWLNDWPGGIKLNYELASMFTTAFLWASTKWDGQIIAPLTTVMPELVYLVGASAYGGTTLFLSVISDVLSLLTLHLFGFYIFATSLFRWHIALLRAVFNIFRGKRYNTLRHRVEPAVYETDQLLLGTILFMLAAFLFPTVLAFYLAFATVRKCACYAYHCRGVSVLMKACLIRQIRVIIIAFHALDEFMLAFMNGFPQFVLLLLLKDPARLPGGIRFNLFPPNGQTKLGQSLTMELLNQPIPASLVLSQHLHLSLLLATHYSPKKFILHLLQGESLRHGALYFQKFTPLIASD
ncbi:BZ3500_MvSof-1268-A1-R1_Chr4-2g07206 [Microbotryum saponariae]|uniref:BZ3500_MvSof-1268-A1-R1_Chr4-2g07206 protein n=1 Tax=Microbotryum saponariae TaxID=289078 RepID=A0A2X0KZJ8_9BASI|nr:BZ3500_MvSof-1268-A1-R1_Chr4-2g07206 [Microbotryum saponariae]SDA06871.1 BZ3501_MvSof-1269-A2-R1_Chr4-2g06917 [Microbotryum saponariae]